MISRVLADRGDHPVMIPYHQHWRQAADGVAGAWPRELVFRLVTERARHGWR